VSARRCTGPGTTAWPAYGLALVALAPLLMGVDLLKSRNRAVEDGNNQMKEGKAEGALEHYEKALAKLPGEPGVHFNRGTALYGLSRGDEAAQSFLRATETKAPALKAAAFYNLGNAYFQTDKFGDAIEAFKKSLAYDPNDVRAKWNLELALKKKQEQDEKQEQDRQDRQDQEKSGDKRDKDQQAQDDKSNEDGKSDKQDKQDQKNGRDQGKDQDEKQAAEDPKQQQPDSKPEQEKKDQNKPDSEKHAQAPEQQGSGGPQNQVPADMREIDAILDSLERSPKALEQERARLRAVRRAPPAKDW
jgi:Ca-activated chloride channel homolog